MEYDFEVQYKPGLENKAANALSRFPTYAKMQTLTVSKGISWEQLRLNSRLLYNYYSRTLMERMARFGMEECYTTKGRWFYPRILCLFHYC